MTDAWHPQVNGVVRTMGHVVRELRAEGRKVRVVHPGLFRTVPCPSEPQVRLAPLPLGRLRALVDRFAPDAIHVSTEGPLGLAARHLCVRRGWPFTTSFHTRFPDYLRDRLLVPRAVTWRFLRWFHRPATRTLVSTATLGAELRARGFDRVTRWTRGVDVELFHPRRREELGLPRPVHLYVGRLAVEKSVEAFLRLPLEGSKVVVGDGPLRRALERRHPEARFLGVLEGEALARAYASSDVFVFPSRTDTFGLVLLEALASGLPVAAHPVPGPRDVVGDAPVGALDEDLFAACRRARAADRAACRRHALGFTWSRCARLFADALAPIAENTTLIPIPRRPRVRAPALDAPAALAAPLPRPEASAAAER